MTAEPASADPKPGSEALPLTGILLMVAVGIGWGLNWVAIRAAVIEISPWSFRAWCLIVGSVGLLTLARVRMGRLTFPRRQFWPLLLLSLLNVTGFQLLVAFGLSMLEAGRGAILGQTHPLWTVIIGALLLKEALTAERLIALALGLGAMALLIVPDLAAIGRAPWGAVLIVAATASWSLGTVLFKRFDLSLTAIEFTAWQLTFGAVPIVACALILDPMPDLGGLSERAIAALIYTPFVAVVLIQWAWYRALPALCNPSPPRNGRGRPL